MNVKNERQTAGQTAASLLQRIAAEQAQTNALLKALINRALIIILIMLSPLLLAILWGLIVVSALLRR